MSTNRSSLTILLPALAALLVLASAATMLSGCAQIPEPTPSSVPTIVVPTPTQEPSPPSAYISGRVWHDLCAVAGGEGGAPALPSSGCVPAKDGSYQANGLLEIGEPGLGGVSIQLGAGACPVSGLATIATDTGGGYAFTGLGAGTYCVSVDALSADNALLLPGSWTFPADGADTGAASFTISLLEGEQRSEINFGWDYQFLPPAGPVPLQPSPTPTPVQPTPEVACTNKAVFVKDLTIPDNTRLLPGQSFVKTWRLRNSGTCTWDSDYALVFAAGHNMGGAQVIPLAHGVAPDETVDLSVTLTAPAGVGLYESEWQLRNVEGATFGIGRNADEPFWVRIAVASQDTPTPTPTSVPTPTTAATPISAPAVDRWRGEYYASRDLTGALAIVRDDAEINFDWDAGAPAMNLPADGFSVRWSRVLSLSAGTYRFYALSDDGVRVWLNGELIIDQWHDAFNVTYVAERTLETGAHAFRVEYFESGGTARVVFWWERLGDFPQWRGAYYPNVDLSGVPILVRNDTDINFVWGRGAPAPGLPADGFSARWTRSLAFEEALYRFRVAVDDGVRLYVDDALVIDSWRDGSGRVVTGDYRLSAGFHTLRLEYYERDGDASIQVWWDELDAYPDWRGEYWSNPTLSGSPALVRNDVTIDFTWGWGAPAIDLPSDSFSARWTRKADFEAAIYRFHVIADDGARLWVDDRLIIDDWRDGAARELTADYPLAQGQHSLRLEFYEHVTDARIRLWWEKVTPPPYLNWKGEYWSNRSLSGSPALLRDDAAIDFRWGSGAAASGLPVDSFSARWSRQVSFERGVHVFYASADDGIRVYLDGELVVNEWHSSYGTDVYTVTVVLTGAHWLTVEYYEGDGEALVKFWWEKASKR